MMQRKMRLTSTTAWKYLGIGNLTHWDWRNDLRAHDHLLYINGIPLGRRARYTNIRVAMV